MTWSPSMHFNQADECLSVQAAIVPAPQPTQGQAVGGAQVVQAAAVAGAQAAQTQAMSGQPPGA